MKKTVLMLGLSTLILLQNISMSHATDCPEGQTYFPGPNRCISTDCPEGQFFHPGALSCYSCTSEFGSNCTKCTYSSCTSCAEGYFPSITYRNPACKAQSTVPNCLSWSERGCEECPQGMFFTVGDDKCSTKYGNPVICPKGKYPYGTMTDPRCINCPTGCAACSNTGKKCTECANGYLQKGNQCVDSSVGCGNGYLEKNGYCISSSLGCGAGYKDMGGFCNRIRYTPAEAAAILNDDDNEIIITFKK